MPEGPEVRIIGESLAKQVSSKKITAINVLSGRYTKKPLPGLDYALSNTPLDIVGVGVHGKFMYWITRNDVFLYNTLGMTGRWSNVETSHARVEFCFDDGKKIFFEDQRNFGTLKFVVGRENLISKLNGLGPDLLASNIPDTDFIDRLRKKEKWSVCKALMDQSVVAGIGNYVKAESLWRARLSPHRPIEDITDQEMSNLRKCCQEVLYESYSSGGASIKTYTRPDGTLGQYSQRFAVYNQKTDPDGNNVVKEKTSDGRTTHWVPSIQF